MTQEELEAGMVQRGINAANARFRQTESNDGAYAMPYASAVYRDYVEPIAALIQLDIDSARAGRNKAHIAMLKALDPWAVAYIAVRTALNTLISADYKVKDNIATVRKMMALLGGAVHRELYLAQFHELEPDLYYTLAEEMGRRRVNSVTLRLRIFKQAAAKAGLEFFEWSVMSRDAVGAFLLECMTQVGFLHFDAPRPGSGRRGPIPVTLTDPVSELVVGIKNHYAINHPLYGPCIAPPREWPGFFGGGWHTPDMQRTLPFFAKARSSVREALQHRDMPIVTQALNAMQNTAWAINPFIKDVAMAVSQTHFLGEFVAADTDRKPEPLEFMDAKPKAEWTDEERVAFTGWKARAAEWYARQRNNRNQRYRLSQALRMANEYQHHEALYFVHFCDSRGRVYPMTQGVSPQGTDLQKGLIEFKQGMRLDTPAADLWFHVQGANKYGFDKATLQDRYKWVEDHRQLIFEYAQHPLDTVEEWMQADSPLQFLAWCREYHLLHELGPTLFHSHLPISLDGSCSGLQHFSAMLRDDVGGKATNLLPSDEMHDVYREVAAATQKRLEAVSDDPEGYRQRWLQHGISRSVCKRPTMTTPYGITKRSARDYIYEDYVAKHPELSDNLIDGKRMAEYLIEFMWPAIGDVIIKGRQAMDWLHKSAGQIIKAGTDGTIAWETPSGFLASQAYYKAKEHRVDTMLHGHQRVLVLSEGPDSNKAKHSAGFAPNFVHSMDAAHLHRTAARMAREFPGVSLAMIHDDFGTHAARTATLSRVLREELVGMYTEHDVLQELAERYQLDSPPAKGSMDLRRVMDAQFAFC